MLKTLALTATLAASLGCTAAPEGTVKTNQARMPFAIERLTESFEGTAREVLQVSGYTYVAVDTGAAGGVRWTVALHKDIDEGARVRVRAFGMKEAFESKKLGRTFDELWFALITPVPVPVTGTEETNEGDRS